MRSSKKFAFLLALVLLASVSVAQEGGDDVGAAIDALASKYEEGWGAADASACTSIYAEDAVSVDLFGATHQGRAAIEENIAATLETYGESTITITRTSLHEVSDDLIVSDGTWEVQGSSAEGAPTQGFYSIVVTRSGGEWLISHGQAKVAPPMMTSEE